MCQAHARDTHLCVSCKWFLNNPNCACDRAWVFAKQICALYAFFGQAQAQKQLIVAKLGGAAYVYKHACTLHVGFTGSCLQFGPVSVTWSGTASDPSKYTKV